MEPDSVKGLVIVSNPVYVLIKLCSRNEIPTWEIYDIEDTWHEIM